MPEKCKIEKIVVRGTNWIGDAVMSVPALRELSRIFPDSEIVLHTKAALAGLFGDADFIDRVLPYEKRGSKIRQAISQADLLVDENFDLAILLPNSFEVAASASMARVPIRIGYNKDLRGLLLTDPIAVPEWKEKRHEVLYYLNLIAEVERRFVGSATVGQGAPDTSIPVALHRQMAARRFLEAAGLDPERPMVALGAGSTNSRAKRWGIENFAALNDRLQEDLSVQVLLVGDASEKEVAAAVIEAANYKPFDITGQTGVAEAAAVLSVADLLVSNDMGLAHVAPSVGTRTAVIFGPTDPITTRPLSEKAVVIRHEVECSPCMLRDCPIDHRCMTRVTVDSVFNACRDMLNLNELDEQNGQQTAGGIH